jgi:hypothetical protein
MYIALLMLFVALGGAAMVTGIQNKRPRNLVVLFK